MRRQNLGLITVLICALGFGCSSESSEFSIQKFPIINGTQITGNGYLATVGIVQELNPGDYHALCTGTLIAPDYVLTAAHCVADCNDGSESIEALRPTLRIGIGQSVRTFRYIGEISEYHVHPEYICEENDLFNDIAVLKLTESVPESVTPPAYAISSALDIQSEDVDSEDGVIVVRAGYGRRDVNDLLSTGLKYKTEGRIYARCPTTGTQSSHCGEKYTRDKGFLYFDASETGTCQGDSGGPVLLNKNGYEFVIGVTSYGYDDCKIMDVAANLSEYENFIAQYVPLLQEWPFEICDDKADNDGDTLVDCDDDECKQDEACKPPKPDVEPEEENSSSGGCSMHAHHSHIWLCLLPLIMLRIRRRGRMQ